MFYGGSIEYWVFNHTSSSSPSWKKIVHGGRPRRRYHLFGELMSELEVGPFVLRERSAVLIWRRVWLVGGFRVFRQLEGLSKGLWHAVFCEGLFENSCCFGLESIAAWSGTQQMAGRWTSPQLSFPPCGFPNTLWVQSSKCFGPPKQILWRPWRSQNTWVFGRFWRGLSKGSYHWAYGYVASIPPLIDISNCIFNYRIWEFNIADFESIPNLL